jgi:tetratricopeptide (TPR) repeat protein
LGHLDEAEQILQREIQIAAIHEGTVSNSVRLSMRHLGVLLRNNGRFEAANQFLTGALEISIKLYGEDSTEIASELNALGQLRMEQNQLEDARQLLERSLMIRRADPEADMESIRSVQERLDLVLQRLR